MLMLRRLLSSTPVLLTPSVLKRIMATDTRVSELNEPVELATYRFTRPQQLGIDSIHGVPGDCNLVAPEYLSPCNQKWVVN